MGLVNLNIPALALVTSMVFASAVQAQGNGNIRDFSPQGFLEFNSFTVPLVHEAFTGEPVHVRDWLDHSRDVNFKDSTKIAVNTLRFTKGNEFETRDAQAVLDPIMAQVESQIRSGRKLLLSLDANLEPYDFQRGGFPTQFSLHFKNPKGSESFYCAGANGSIKRPKPAYTTSCVVATNLNGNDPIFSFYPVAEQSRAQMIRERFNRRQLGFIATVEQDGNYRPTRDASLRFGGFLRSFVVNGVLPVRILTLMVFDRESGEILDTSQAQPRAGATKAKAEAQGEAVAAPAGKPDKADKPVGVADAVLFRFDEPASGKSAVPDAKPVEEIPAAPVQYGPPRSSGALRMVQLLSLLSYTVYSSPERIAEAQRNAAQSSDEAARIEAEDGRIQIIQASEMKDSEKQIGSRERRLQQLLDMQQLKLSAQARFGAKFIEGVTYKDIYYERFSLPDGRTIVVYRGTSNLKDVKADLQLALSPQSIAEINKSSKSLVVPYGVAGLDAYANGGAKGGNPASFQAAVDTVDRLVRLGVRPERMVLAGHSLGGGYAHYAGYKRQVGEIVTFNPSPLSETQRQELQSSVESFRGKASNFIAYLPPAPNSASTQGTYDPVSQKLANYRNVVSDVSGLQVPGPQYVIEICDTKGSPEYHDFHQTLQKVLAAGNLAVAGMGRLGVKTGTFGTAVGAAAGSVASAFVGTQGDKAWDTYSAHKMQNLFEALLDDAAAHCAAKKKPALHG